MGMSMVLEDVAREAMGLPRHQRLALARLLIELDDPGADADVEAAAGRSISDIFVDDGEGAFRVLERQTVAEALASHDGVLAVGGGAVLDETTQTALAGRRVVFLDVGIKDAASRVGFNRDRPLLLGNPRAQWVKLMEVRRPVYERVATATVLTDGRAPQDIAEEIVTVLAEAGQ